MFILHSFKLLLLISGKDICKAGTVLVLFEEVSLTDKHTVP